MVTEIISGTVIALISFGLGYFLFTVQRRESVRLELFKKRLESYDKIMSFLQKLDQEIIAVTGHNFELSKEEKEKFVLKIYNLTLPRAHYLSSKVYRLLEPKMVNCIDFLPDTAADLEILVSEIEDTIVEEVGSYLIEPTILGKIIGRKSKLLLKEKSLELEEKYKNYLVAREKEESLIES